MKIVYTTKTGIPPHDTTANAKLIEDNNDYNITIKVRGTDSDAVIEPNVMVLEVTFSEGIQTLACEKLSSLDKDLVVRYGLPSGATKLAWLVVPYGKLAIFYSCLPMLDATITSEQLRELRHFLNPHSSDNQLSKQTFFENPISTRKQLLEKFAEQKHMLDEGTINLIDDLSTQPVSTEINQVMRKALLGLYHDFGNILTTPKLTLIEHLRIARADKTLVQNAMYGRYDSIISAKIHSNVKR